MEQAQQIANGVRVLTEWLGHGGNPVEAELAQRRADVCLKCPKNVKKWAMTLAIAEAVKEQIGLKNSLSMRVDGEKSLHTCEACSCQLRLKVWCPINLILPEPTERYKYWEHCWLLTEQP